MIEFKRTLHSKATIVKKSKYDFKDFTDAEIEEGRKGTYDNPKFFNKDGCWYGFYSDDEDNNRLCIVMYHTWDKFKEIREGDKDV